MRHTYVRWLVVLLAVLLLTAVVVFALVATQGGPADEPGTRAAATAPH